MEVPGTTGAGLEGLGASPVEAGTLGVGTTIEVFPSSVHEVSGTVGGTAMVLLGAMEGTESC